MRWTVAAVRAERDRYLDDAHAGHRGADDHLGSELHTARAEIERPVGLLREGPHPAVHVRHVRTEEPVEEARRDGVPDV